MDEHFRVLRKEFAWVLIPSALIFAVSLVLSPLMIISLISYLNLGSESVVTLSPFEGINTMILLSGMITLTLSMPLLLFSLYRFSKPALSNQVMRGMKQYVVWSAVIAVFGIVFGIFLFSKLVLLTLSSSYQIASPMWSVMSIVKFVIVSGLSIALFMQIIILLPALKKLGLINVKSLKEKRWLIIIVILVVCAMITPPDVISQLLLFIPSYGSFELGLLLSKVGGEQKCWV